MSRLTKVSKEGYRVSNEQVKLVENGYAGEAIDRLAQFENIYDNLIAEQGKISQQLEELRNTGKKNSVKFKELLLKKLNNSFVISIYKANGLD